MNTSNNLVYKWTRQIFPALFFSIPALYLLIACEMAKELDIEAPYFPPKLSVTAILNGQNGTFEIRLMEGLSLAEFKQSYSHNKNVVRNGEIRLYEDDEIILSIPGPFDMSAQITNFGDGWKYGQNGYYRIRTGISTHPGSVYRLEAELEGFPMAVSTSVMPMAPVVSISVDPATQVIKKHVREIGVAGLWMYQMSPPRPYGHYPEKYWPFSVTVDIPGENNYFAFNLTNVEANRFSRFWGIGSADASVLMEDGMADELFGNRVADLYLFPFLVTKTISKDVTRNFYAAVPDNLNSPDYGDSYLEEHPEMEKIPTHHALYLQVRHISPATYQYIRTLSLQLEVNRLNEQPSIVVGNIEGGYGIFSVYNVTPVLLVEWETYEYRRKEE